MIGQLRKEPRGGKADERKERCDNGGAVEICKILGKDETIRRVKRGIEKLGG